MRRPSHVVMLVGNDIAVDTRVKKTAASLARLGLSVTVVGYSPTGVRETARMAGCDVIRVPIPWTHRDSGRTLPRPVLSPRAQSRVRLRERRQQVIEWGTRPTSARLRPARKALKLAGLYGLKGAQAVLDRVMSDEVPHVEEPEELSLPWRSTVPIALDYVEAFTPEVVRLRPDVIHAHDVHTIPVASIAAEELERATGVRPWWIYDAHEFIAGLSLYGRRDAVERAGWLNLEQEYAPGADAIITVSPDLAEELRGRYPQVPRVDEVLNAPWHTDERPRSLGGGVRGQVGVGADVPLVVYSGVVTDARGVRTAIEAVPYLRDAHLAVVSTTFTSPLTDLLRERAEALGVSDRVHIVPPVPAHEVVAHLSTADIGLIPIRRFPSHDVALTNKLFEYLHAGLPVVVSDCPAQKRFVRIEDIGAVHVTDDPFDLALAVRAVVEDLDRYRARARRRDLVRRYSWQESEHRLAGLYSELLGAHLTAPPGDSFADLQEDDVTGTEVPA